MALVYLSIDSHFYLLLQDFIASENKPKATRVTRVIQGYEPHSFKSNFDSWPSGSATPANEEGRGKVAGKDCFDAQIINEKLSDFV